MPSILGIVTWFTIATLAVPREEMCWVFGDGQTGAHIVLSSSGLKKARVLSLDSYQRSLRSDKMSHLNPGWVTKLDQVAVDCNAL